MKKLLIGISIFMLFDTIGLAACDGSTKNARTNALIYDDSLTLKFIKKATAAGDYQTFSSELSLSELKTEVDAIELEVGTLTSEIVNERFLLVEKLIPFDKVNYYLIADITKTTESDSFRYHFSPCYSSFEEGNDPDDKKYIVHVPHHYFVFDPDADYPLEIQYDTPYELTGTKDDIFEFYNKVSIYDVTDEDNRIVVDVKDDAEIAGRHTKADVVIYFEEEEGKVFARYKSE